MMGQLVDISSTHFHFWKDNVKATLSHFLFLINTGCVGVRRLPHGYHLLG